MERKKLRTEKKVIEHLIYWIVLTVFFSIVDPVEGAFGLKVFGTLLIMFMYAFVFYIETILIFPKFYRRKIPLFFLMGLTLLCYSLLFRLIDNSLFGEGAVESIFYGEPLYSVVISNAVQFSIISVIALGAYQNQIGIAKLKATRKNKPCSLKSLAS